MNSYMELKDEFLKYWSIENNKDNSDEKDNADKKPVFKESSVEVYKRKIEVFFEYLNAEIKVKEAELEDYLQMMDSKVLINNIAYYVDKYNINSAATINIFYTVVKCFFEFLGIDKKIINIDFNSKLASKEFDDLVKNEILRLKLPESEVKETLTKEQFEELHTYCDKEIDNFSIEEFIKRGIHNRDKECTLFTSAIIVKIVMLTGVKNAGIEAMVKNDYIGELNKIKINNRWIYLPDTLSKQMRKYMVYRAEVFKNKDELDVLFVRQNGKSLFAGTERNYYAYEILQVPFSTNSSAMIGTYVIGEMIKKKADVSAIMGLTGYALGTYFYCRDFVNEESDISNRKTKDEYANDIIRNLEAFYKL